jgi:cleavage and polyadenylation specificity factor subunit 3
MKTIKISNNNPQYVKIKDEEILEIIPLGAGCEVGRSCIFLKFAGINIMLDCGIHPAHNGLISLPYFDMINPAEIDFLLITHFHLDHCGALPYFLTKTNFTGKCYMTQPTKELYRFLISDYIKVSHVRTEEALYNDNDLENSMSKINVIHFKETTCLSFRNTEVRFTAYNAGHVLGAAMFHIEIENVSILYTGDFSREEDRHLQPAEIPNVNVNVLIIESTYGVQNHDPRNEREQTFKKLIADVVRKQGKCLLPVMISGRVQELLLILEEFWSKEENKDLQDVKIYFVSSLASKCLSIFQKNTSIMGQRISKNFLNEGTRNPFDFQYIISVKNEDEMKKMGYSENKPAVVFASPGMLQQGLSRDLFEKWYDSENNATIITGYCVEGTFAKELLKDPDEIKLSNGKKVKLKMKVHNVTFSAHSDFKDTNGFITSLKPKKIVLVHGENREMKKLKDEMERRIKTNFEKQQKKKVNEGGEVDENDKLSSLIYSKIYNPQNCQKIQFFYKMKKTKLVNIVGNIYNKIQRLNLMENILFNKFENSDILNPSLINTNKIVLDHEVTKFKDQNFIEFNGIVVNDFVLDLEDISAYTDYKPYKLKNIIQLNFTKDLSSLLCLINKLYIFEFKVPNIFCNEHLTITLFKGKVVLEWVSSTIADQYADSICQILIQIEKYPDTFLSRVYLTEDNYISDLKRKIFIYFQNKYLIELLKTEEIETLILYKNNEKKADNIIARIDLDKMEVINDKASSSNVNLISKVQSELEFFINFTNN